METRFISTCLHVPGHIFRLGIATDWKAQAHLTSSFL